MNKKPTNVRKTSVAPGEEVPAAHGHEAEDEQARQKEKEVAKALPKKAAKKAAVKAASAEAQQPAPAKKAASKKAAVTTGDDAAVPVKKPARQKAAAAPAATPDPAAKKAARKSTAKKAAVTPVAEETTPAPPATQPAASVKPAVAAKPRRLVFQVRFSTSPGDNLYLLGDHELLGNNHMENAVPLHYFNEDFWYGIVEFDETQQAQPIQYNYFVRYADGTLSADWGRDKRIDFNEYTQEDILLIDSWNHAGFYENAFMTEPFVNVLLKKEPVIYTAAPENTTHLFRVKAPLLQAGEIVCLTGSAAELRSWDWESPILLNPVNGHFEVALDLSAAAFPFTYKYGVFNTETQQLVKIETGDNRYLFDELSETKLTIVNDGFAVLDNSSWRGAGVAIPVFSLRTRNGLGIGEFNDLKPFSDWARQAGLKVIQILPVNDSTATYGWMDSYPYASISAFALNPVYLHLQQLLPEDHPLQAEMAEHQQNLNDLADVDYPRVAEIKRSLIARIYPLLKDETFASADYQAFFEENRHWLVAYATFSYLRDQNGTPDFNQWPEYRKFVDSEVLALSTPGSPVYDAIALHYFTQYQLHRQLRDVFEYVHTNQVIIKGDLPIGIYRYGSDAWQQPELYHMDEQAGAPPDSFTVSGQNWAFPTYDWQRMKEDGYRWWKRRFRQMSYYFDAFRIDHILGFFRIWSIPVDAVEGIMGRFVPAIPVHVSEFQQNGIYFDHRRYTMPFITHDIIEEVFGDLTVQVKEQFLEFEGEDTYSLKPAFHTQKLVDAYFEKQEATDQNNRIRKGLFNLISNVIVFTDKDRPDHYHFRFNMDHTASFRYFDPHTQGSIRRLYINYFFERQDEFWRQQAMQKLPALKRTTNMLVCGEDLGLVPGCVPDVMNRLGILSLEIQRMPKDHTRQFFHPNDAPYLSVVTPSTHDMSTIRGWWEEDRTKTQQFYNEVMGEWGNAPYFCEPWVVKKVIEQHVYSPAMWSIFQLQDLFGMTSELRTANPVTERINVPADPRNKWCYRMKVSVEDLMNETGFNTELLTLLQKSGRA